VVCVLMPSNDLAHRRQRLARGVPLQAA
jgi:hypothetical protein